MPRILLRGLILERLRSEGELSGAELWISLCQKYPLFNWRREMRFLPELVAEGQVIYHIEGNHNGTARGHYRSAHKEMEHLS